MKFNGPTGLSFSQFYAQVMPALMQPFLDRPFPPVWLAKLYVGRMEVMFDQNLFPSKEYKVSDIYMEWFSYHIHGMATLKGIELLNKNILHSAPSTKKKNSKKQ